MRKLVVILGPTASGKTKLAIKLASRFNGEIISADSRQVYRGMDIGTGKDLDDYKIQETKNKKQETRRRHLPMSPRCKIPHHLIDIINPKNEFSLAKYQQSCYQKMNEIWARGNIPFLVGGTGLYIEAILNNYQIPAVKPNFKLRNRLEKLDITKLLKQLKKLDRTAYMKADKKNKRRVIRALEIALDKKQETRNKKQDLENYEFRIIGIKKDKPTLNKLINRRVDKMVKQGLIQETKKLHSNGVSWKKLESFGLEYKYTALFLQKKISQEKMIGQIKISNCQFAKRQMTWFRGMERRNADNKINWAENYQAVKKLIKQFMAPSRWSLPTGDSSD